MYLVVGFPKTRLSCAIALLEGFKWCGLTLNPERNLQIINREGRISTDDSRLHAYVIPVEEGLVISQVAIRCANST